MNKLCKFLLTGLLIGASLLLAPLNHAAAQSAPDPAIVISIANFDDQMTDVDYLCEAAGFAQMKFMAKTMISQYTKGIDPKSPAGIMIYFSAGSKEPDFLAFLPVSNLDDLLDTISGYAEVDEGDDFTTIVTDDETQLLVKKFEGNAFISNRKEMFENLPTNPAEMLGEMPKKYNLAAQVFGQRIPEEMRGQALDAFRDGYERQLEQLEEVEPVQAELQRKNLEFQMKQFASWINETDNLTFGMCADKESSSLFMDVAIKALPKSNLAERFAASAPKEKSMFGGFLMEGAAFTNNTCMSLHPDEAADYVKMLDQVKEAVMEGVKNESDLDEEESKLLGKSLDSLIEIGKETLKQGNVDSGAVAMVDKDGINFAGGFRMANTKQLEDTVKEIVAFAEEKMGDEIQVNLNSGSHQGVTFHQILIQVPDDEEEMREIMGDQVTLIVGIGANAVYVAAGSNPLPLVKKAMDSEGTGMKDLMQYNLYVAPILKFAAGINGEAIIENMAAELEANGKDRMSMTSNLIDNGVSMRFEMQDGILALIKVGVESMGQGGFQGGNNDF